VVVLTYNPKVASVGADSSTLHHTKGCPGEACPLRWALLVVALVGLPLVRLLQGRKEAEDDSGSKGITVTTGDFTCGLSIEGCRPWDTPS